MLREANLRANVYRVADPTSDTLTSLGYVNEAGEVHASAALVGRVTAEGAVLGADDAPMGYVTEAGAVYRGTAGALEAGLAGHAAREGSIYRGAALSPQAVVGYVDPRATRPQMGGAALLLGLLD